MLTRVDDTIIATLRAKKEKLSQNVRRALFEEAKIELAEMKRRTPVWNPARPVPKGHIPGSLRQSGRLEDLTTEAPFEVSFVFGGYRDVDYALWVHEDLEAHHAIGEAKFITSVLNESRPFMARRLADRIKSYGGMG